DVAAGDRGAERDTGHRDERDQDDAPEQADATGAHPARPRERRGEQELEAARRLVRGPYADEGRGGEAGQQQAELDEDELQEAADRTDVDVGEDRCEQALEVRRVVELVDERLT